MRSACRRAPRATPGARAASAGPLLRLGKPPRSAAGPRTEDSETRIEIALERAVAWTSALNARGIGAQPLVSAAELMRDPWVVAHGLSVTRSHEGGDTITTIGPPFRLSRTPVVPGAPASPPGADAEVVLATIGMADRLDDLVGRGAISA